MKAGVRFATALIIPFFFSILAHGADPAPSPAAGDAVFEEGKVLAEKSCNSCHNGELFSPEMRKVKTVEQLKKMVEKCSGAAGTGWTDKQKEAVVHYLSLNYYKF